MSTEWSRIDIAGKPATLFAPPSPRFAVVFLHGTSGETLADSPAWTHHLRALNLACVCPSGGLTWWADKLLPDYDPAVTAERYVVDSVLPFTRERFHRGVGLTGISMGGQGALRIAFKHPDLFPAVAAVAPAVEYHQWYGYGHSLDAMYTSKEQARQDTAPMHVHPSRQPPHVFFCVDPTDADWWRGNDRLHEKLTALGVAHECDLTTQAGGHTWTYYDAMAERALRFLATGLDIESRRLL